MRKLIATVCLSGSLAEKLEACSLAGFDGVEIFENDLVVSPESPAEIAKRAADLGLSIELYQPFRDFEGVTQEILDRNLARAAAKFRLMNELGTELILVCSNVATATIPDDEIAAQQLNSLADLAAAHGVRVAYEALAWGRYVSDFEHAHRIIQLAGNPALGACLDSFHILSRGWDPTPIEQLPAQEIFFCQLADAPRLNMDILSWSRHHRLFPGEGGWDLPGFMSHLLRTGYDGPVSLEVFNDVFRQSPPKRTAIDAMRSLVWLESQTADLQRGAVDAQRSADKRPSMVLAELPQTDQPSGINFVEVKSDQLSEVEKVLDQLGFESHGRHRTKPVQLWMQGRARIILNEQQVGHQSPTVAAIGFDVADPDTASERAQLLKATPVPRDNGVGEETLHAVAAPSGTEVFFCPDSPTWTTEFGPAREPSASGGTSAAVGPARITHIDHVNLSQPWQYFDESILFYESILSLTAQASSEVAAPSGLVRSQVMRSDDGAVRLALNIAPLALEGSGASAAASYPEHIAFSTEDLIATARRALDRGMEFLPVPPNYYDDLDARLQVSPDLLATLKELNLLFDRDENGEFLHFYTRTFGTVFFEVVERRGSYGGYGAPNAPVRLAVQYKPAVT